MLSENILIKSESIIVNSTIKLESITTLESINRVSKIVMNEVCIYDPILFCFLSIIDGLHKVGMRIIEREVIDI